jgi:DNA-binding LytR/AlgR family response regulator
MPTALLVDDEPNLSRHLARKLSRLWPELTVVGTPRSGREALACVAGQRPDIVFLDIRMPGLDGLQVAKELPPEVRVVFVTAYDDYAVQAFEAAAVDYLLKPVNDERLALTVQRLLTGAHSMNSLAGLLERLRHPSADHYLQWIRAGRGEAVTLIPVSAVVYFQADRKYTTVRTAGEEHLIRTAISELEQRLNPDEFWRVHRGTIVAAREVVEARRDLRGRYNLRLRSRPEPLRVSQSYSHLFRQM